MYLVLATSAIFGWWAMYPIPLGSILFLILADYIDMMFVIDELYIPTCSLIMNTLEFAYSSGG